MEMTTEWPNLQFHMRGVDMDFELDYKMVSNPEWIKDSGSGKITIRGMNISLILETYELDGKLAVNFTSEPVPQAVNLEDYQFTITGQTDFSKTYNYMMN